MVNLAIFILFMVNFIISNLAMVGFAIIILPILVQSWLFFHNYFYFLVGLASIILIIIKFSIITLIVVGLDIIILPIISFAIINFSLVKLATYLIYVM